MKKFLIMSLFLLLFVTGCVGLPVIYEGDSNNGNTPDTPEVPEVPEVPVISGESVKTGLAIITNIGGSVSKNANFDITLVAVTVTEDGVINSCKIDSVGTDIKFDENGEITTNLTKEVLTKYELGDAYNMETYGGAIAEWYEQADALAQYCVGKTAEEVAGISVDENTKPTDTDLNSSVTIAIGSYKEAIVKAVNNAKDLGANHRDVLHMAASVSVSSSKNATADSNGVAEVDVDVTAVTERYGYITSCAIDSVQAKVEFDVTGAIASDLTKEVLTKHELGDAYGMVAWGGAIAEWNEQTNSFCDYIKGKTAQQVNDIAVNEGTKPTEPDLSTSVTIAIGGYKALIAEALENVVVGKAVKTGLAILTNLSNKSGKASFDITIVAVTVDAKGVITSCKIDNVGTDIEIGADGKIATALSNDIKSKYELGDAYGMVAWGGAIGEWYEQADALAAYCVGKTAEQVTGISVDEGTKPTDTDLNSSVTIAIGSYKEAIVKAVNNAKFIGANSSDTLKLAVNASSTDSVDATAAKNGTVQINVDAALVTEKNGYITSCAIDSVQAKIEFDVTGAIVSDFTKEVLTKHELGDAYGMVAWAGAAAEWCDQTNTFCQYVTGKTAQQVAGISVDAGTKPSIGSDLSLGVDLPTSVTIAIGGYKALIAEALA
ncbi:MAG: hypothetical protein J6R47_01035 [Acholeplasmatales bacterium]|nr:hypothetical protein [Acholeplasmatales bacterium]